MASPNVVLHTAGGNLARPTHYDVIITIPPEVNQLKLNNNSWNLLAKSITIPVSKMETIEYKYKGHVVHLPGVVQVDNVLPITFILDENYNFSGVLQTWVEGMDLNHTSSTDAGDKLKALEDKPKGNIVVIGNNWDNSPVVRYEFQDVYPISVNGPEFSTDSVSSVMDLSAEFAFSHFYINNIPESSGPIESAIERKLKALRGVVDITKNTIQGNIKKSIDGSISKSIGKTNEFFKNL